MPTYPAGTVSERRPKRADRFNVRDARWTVRQKGWRLQNRTFYGDGSFDYTPISFGSGADDCVIEGCDFIDCFRGPDVAGAKRLRLINCTVRFTAPTAQTAQYGFYAINGEDITYAGCAVEGAWLDSFKAALDCKGVTYIDCTSRNSGNGSPEGGAFDVAYGGHVTKLIGCKAYDSNGVDVAIKTHQNFPSTVGDVEIIGFHSENAKYFVTVEAPDSLDYPDPPANPGVRDEAKRINIIGGIVKNAHIGAKLNSQHITMTGTQFHDCKQEGYTLERNARDIDISAVKVVACARDYAGTKPGITIRGAQSVTIAHGLIDGKGSDDVTYHRAAIEIFDKDEDNLADDIVIDKVRMRNVTATGSPIVACFSETASVIVDVWGDGDPTGSPGMHGSQGSTYRRKSNGAIYKKTTAANTVDGWEAL
jgi:hypothetical protein